MLKTPEHNTPESKLFIAQQKADGCSFPGILVSHRYRSDTAGTADRKPRPDH